MTNEVPAAGIEPRTFRVLSECANYCAKPAGWRVGEINLIWQKSLTKKN